MISSLFDDSNVPLFFSLIISCLKLDIGSIVGDQFASVWTEFHYLCPIYTVVMGLTIFYSGRFNPEASLHEMIEEVKDICEVQKWEYHIFEREFPALPFPEEYDGEIYGICFSPPESETVSLEFLSNGRMSGAHLLHLWGDSDNEEYKQFIYTPFTKTQFAGYEVHALIVEIFRYVSKKYLLDFKMTDEGHYWETNDEKVLDENLDRYEDLIDSFGFALDNVTMNSNETIEEYFSRIIKIIRGKNLK